VEFAGNLQFGQKQQSSAIICLPNAKAKKANESLFRLKKKRKKRNTFQMQYKKECYFGNCCIAIRIPKPLPFHKIKSIK